VHAGNLSSRVREQETWYNSPMRIFSGILPALSLPKGCSQIVGLTGDLCILDKCLLLVLTVTETPKLYIDSLFRA